MLFSNRLQLRGKLSSQPQAIAVLPHALNIPRQDFRSPRNRRSRSCIQLTVPTSQQSAELRWRREPLRRGPVLIGKVQVSPRHLVHSSLTSRRWSGMRVHPHLVLPQAAVAAVLTSLVLLGKAASQGYLQERFVFFPI